MNTSFEKQNRSSSKPDKLKEPSFKPDKPKQVAAEPAEVESEKAFKTKFGQPMNISFYQAQNEYQLKESLKPRAPELKDYPPVINKNRRESAAESNS